MKYFLIAFLLFIFIFGTKPIRGFFRGIFGFTEPEDEKKKNKKPVEDTKSKRGKFFKKDDGEYVDYEEIKEK